MHSTAQIETEFDELAKKWKTETRMHSAISRVTMHPAYLEIIALGPEAIPLILRDLQKESSPWFPALRALAKTSPVSPEEAGNIQKMRQAGLKWGRENGYLRQDAHYKKKSFIFPKIFCFRMRDIFGRASRLVGSRPQK